MDHSDLEARITQGREVVARITRAKKQSFNGLKPSMLPDRPGIYVITTTDGEILRAGRTDKQTLRGRIYRNHLMGNQKGNLRSQLVGAGICPDIDQAKDWIRQHCLVQWLEKTHLDGLGVDIRWAEHFLLAVLRPTFSD